MASDKIDSVLGKNIANYVETYNPDVLVRVSRDENRIAHNLVDADFVDGYDVWHAYEATALLNNGMPFSGIIKIKYSYKTTHIVESKSLKLYLFSFMMEKMGDNEEEATTHYVSIIKRDLSNLLLTDVEVTYFKASSVQVSLPVELSNAYSCIDSEDVETNVYIETPDLLEKGTLKEINYYSHNLRSRCRITKQPDFGTVLIHMKGDNLPTADSILKYIVSFRNENHFHEEIVEAIYGNLLKMFNPEKLKVQAFYTRRGGIDINPVRSNYIDEYSSDLSNMKVINYRMPRS